MYTELESLNDGLDRDSSGQEGDSALKPSRWSEGVWGSGRVDDDGMPGRRPYKQDDTRTGRQGWEKTEMEEAKMETENHQPPVKMEICRCCRARLCSTELQAAELHTTELQAADANSSGIVLSLKAGMKLTRRRESLVSRWHQLNPAAPVSWTPSVHWMGPRLRSAVQQMIASAVTVLWLLWRCLEIGDYPQSFAKGPAAKRSTARGTQHREEGSVARGAHPRFVSTSRMDQPGQFLGKPGLSAFGFLKNETQLGKELSRSADRFVFLPLPLILAPICPNQFKFKFNIRAENEILNKHTDQLV
ncbi:hypothetical protein B0H14DRAFT_3167670 [Mycena olivaceomarginata]|nr:hypothetical protein B0H14DRAFT_3167670 [Mycena olivaceomarginata]